MEPLRGVAMLREVQSDSLFKVLRKVPRNCSAAQYRGKQGGPSNFAGSPPIGLSIEVPWNGGE